ASSSTRGSAVEAWVGRSSRARSRAPARPERRSVSMSGRTDARLGNCTDEWGSDRSDVVLGWTSGRGFPREETRAETLAGPKLGEVTDDVECRGGRDLSDDRGPARPAGREVQARGIPPRRAVDREPDRGPGRRLRATRTPFDPGRGRSDRGEDRGVSADRLGLVLRAAEARDPARPRGADASFRTRSQDRPTVLGRAGDRRTGRAPGRDRRGPSHRREGLRRKEDWADPFG